MSERGKPIRKGTVPAKNDTRRKEVEPKVPSKVHARTSDKSVERKPVGKSRVDKSVERPKNPGRSESLTRNKQTVAPKPINKAEVKPAIKKTTQKPVPHKENVSNKSKINGTTSTQSLSKTVSNGATSKTVSNGTPKTKSSSNKAISNTISKHSLNVSSKATISKSPSKTVESKSQLTHSPQNISSVKSPRSETANLKNGRTRVVATVPDKSSSTTIERPLTGKVRSGGKRENGTAPKAEAIYIPIDLDDEVVDDLAPSQVSQPPTEEEAEDEPDEYEDDFEDYESDFEELSESEEEREDSTEDEVNEESESGHEEEVKQVPTVPPVIRPKTSTIKKHYDEPPVVETLIVKSQQQQSTLLQSNQPASGILKKSPSNQFFNFAKAEKEMKNQTKLAKAQSRSSQLLDLITLDKQIFGIYDSPPANYEVFIQIFGQSNRQQVYVETEPKDEESIQTDAIECLDKWTQLPPSGQAAVGGQKLNKNKYNTETDWLKMNHFLNNTTQLICEILDEEANEKLQSKLNRDVLNVEFSQGFLELNMPEFLTTTSVKEIIFSSNQSNYLLVSHNLLETEEVELKGKSIICLWNLKNITEPEYILLVEGSLSKCALNPGLPNLIFAGMTDGSLSMWNLREPTNTHLKRKAYANTAREFCYRVPTYSTTGIQSQTGHQSSITALQTIVDGSSLNDTQFCQLISLEEFGIVNTWSVIATNNRDLSGFDTDLEMAPGSRLKLVKTARIDLSQASGLDTMTSLGLTTFAMQAFPQDLSRILVTTDLSLIYHFTRHGGTTSPRLYKDEDVLVPIKILCLSFNPHFPIIFATGSDDGNIRIFRDKSQFPILKFPTANKVSKIISLAWSSTHPVYLFSLDDRSVLSIWDISSPKMEPVTKHSFENNLIAFTLHPGSSEEIWSSHMALALRDKGIIIHKLNDKLSQITEEEYQQLMEFLRDL